MSKIIEIENFVKKFGKVTAVNGISFSVNEGNLFAFLGTNGAGKSTTIDTLCTLIKSDEGKIVIDGHVLGEEDQKIREEIGVVFQSGVLDRLLSVRENLEVRGSFYNMGRAKLKSSIERVAELTGSTDFLDRPYGKLSGGQKRRSDIARSLINSPKILFLDEPTTGLDPQTRASIWNTIGEMQKKTGMTVFLTTHYMDEAADADYITIIDKGSIIENGTPPYLKNKYTQDYLKLYSATSKAVEYLKSHKIKFELKHGIIVIPVNGTETAISILNDIKTEIESFELIKGSMDDVFINLIGNQDGKAGDMNV